MILLAAYGTLMTGQPNGLDAEIRARLRNGRPCRIAGRIYEVREEGDAGSIACPGFVPCPPNEMRFVQAELFGIAAADADRVLRALDAYEEFFPDDPGRSIYLRQSLPVLDADTARTVSAWVYVYNRPIDGLRPIEGGDWRRRIRSGSG